VDGLAIMVFEEWERAMAPAYSMAAEESQIACVNQYFLRFTAVMSGAMRR
jgi:hypothetical protein